jgi:hypothetical protein
MGRMQKCLKSKAELPIEKVAWLFYWRKGRGMKKPTLSAVIVMCLMLVPISGFAVDINYPDFSDLSDFTLGANAQNLNTVPDDILQLISGTWQRSGYALLTDPITLEESFSTHFTFQITNNIGIGADWLLFNIQTENGLSAGNAISVEFDIYNNGARDNNNGNHIGVNVNHGFYSVVTQPVTTPFNNEEIWHAWIEYDGNILDVYASMDAAKPASPYISYPIDVPEILGTSEVYLGFRAGSGARGADFAILSWSFESIEPVTCPEDTMAPTGSVHAYPNLIWPPNNKMVTVTLEGRVIDEMGIAQEGGGHGVSSAYLLIDGTNRIILLDDTTDLLDADGYFSVEVKGKKRR